MLSSDYKVCFVTLLYVAYGISTWWKMLNVFSDFCHLLFPTTLNSTTRDLLKQIKKHNLNLEATELKIFALKTKIFEND